MKAESKDSKPRSKKMIWQRKEKEKLKINTGNGDK